VLNIGFISELVCVFKCIMTRQAGEG